MKTSIVTAAIAIVAVLGVGHAPSADAGEGTKPRPAWAEKRCEYEDSTNCFWDARREGNGKGKSFYAREINGLTCIMFVSKKFAKKNDSCYDGRGEVFPRR